MKIVVLGSKGFIGSNLIIQLNKYRNILMTNDVIEIHNLEDLYSKNLKFYDNSLIVDCIGVKSLFYGENKNFLEKESLSKLKNRYKELLDFTSNSNSKFFFICSGGSIYGEYKGRPWIETDDLHPVDSYGMANKLIEELVVQNNGLSIRGSNIYGSLKTNKQNQGILTVALLAYIKNSHIKIDNNGQNVRDYLYIDDFIRGLLNILINNSGDYKIINVSSGEGFNQLELMTFIDEILLLNNKRSIKNNLIFMNQKSNSIEVNILDSGFYKKNYGELKYTDIKKGITFMMRSLNVI